jgi:tRNA nucleotidyltransferase/poly(A) polymerase
MSDYMFMLESHLGADQNRALSEVQNAAASCGMTLFLTGGAMRDMLGGFKVRDLDFTVEGNALKMAKAIAKVPGAEVVSSDEDRKAIECIFPGGVTVGIAMSKHERPGKAGAKPQISPATIHEDLNGRDFSINAIALSLSRSSLGLLLDPTNGLADLERKELRAIYNYSFYDDPTRILRLIRLKVRLGFTVDDRTKLQYENARLAEVEKTIPARRLFEELAQIADEPNAADLIRTLTEEKLLELFLPEPAASKLSWAGLAKLQKARQLIPPEVNYPVENLGLFLNLLTEKLSAKEKALLIKTTAMRKAETGRWEKLESQAKKAEHILKSAKLQKASRVYEALSEVPGEEALFLLIRSSQRLVQDRIHNYLQKYLQRATEVTDEQVVAAGGQPGTPKFKKLKAELISKHLDTRPKPVPPPEPEPALPLVPERGARAR